MSISKAEHDELCCVYAALLLFDDKVAIDAEKLNKVITASGNTVDAYYPEFFGKYFSTADLNAMISNVGSGPAAAGAAPAEAKADDKGKGKDDKAKEKEKKKPEPEPEPEAEGFGGLFD